MWKWVAKLTKGKRAFRGHGVEVPRLILTEASLVALRSCMNPEIRKGEEAIAYLLGRASADQTLIVSATRPVAHTTPGSFTVTEVAMAKVVRCAAEAGLHVAGQAHTHPHEAFHSRGDDEGARIAYDGYVSIVFPDYGKHLPALDGFAAYVYEGERGFVPIPPDRITVVLGRMS